MAATKYQILYRYTNPNSNQFITNDVDAKFKGVFELYHDQHKLEIGTDEEKLQASNEKSNYIIEGNNTANDNYNMLFKFTGTKRINKKVWVPESIGYIIRDKEAVRNLTTRAVDGDFTGDYLLIEGDTIENGVVVAKKKFTNNIIVCEDGSKSINKIYYTSEELIKLITNSTIYRLKTYDISNYRDSNSSVQLNRSHNSNGGYTYSNTVYTGPVFIDEMPMERTGNYQTAASCVLAESNSCKRVIVKSEDVAEYTIPAHYEEMADYPYMIADTYERIEQSPWFVLSTEGSLTSAIEKVKTVVKSVGIDNVKLIKVVPTEQFIKIN